MPRPLLAIAAIAGTLALAGCGGDDDDGGDSGTGEAGAVQILDFKYLPETIEVSAGSEVVWTNDDTTEHTATLDDNSLDTESIAGEGATGSLTFDEPGTYAYYCLFHPFMKGQVEVAE